MKSFILLVSLLASTSAFAAPAPSTTWHCRVSTLANDLDPKSKVTLFEKDVTFAADGDEKVLYQANGIGYLAIYSTYTSTDGADGFVLALAIGDPVKQINFAYDKTNWELGQDKVSTFVATSLAQPGVMNEFTCYK